MLKTIPLWFDGLRGRQLEILMIASVSILVGVAGYGILNDRSVAMRTAHQNALGAADAMQTHISGQFEQAAFSIIGVAENLREMLPPSNEQLRDSVSEAMRYDPVSTFLGFATEDDLMLRDRAGNTIQAYELSEQLKRGLAEVGSETVEILPHVFFREMGMWYVPFALRVADRNGRHGVVLSLVPSNEVIKAAASLHLMSDARFVILTRDGKPLFPNGKNHGLFALDEDRILSERLKDLASGENGTFEYSSARNHLDDVFGYAWADSLPLVVITAIPKHSLEVAWLHRSIMPLLLLAIGCLASIAFAVRLKRASLDLAGSHRLYAQLFRSVDDGLVILGRDGIIHEINDGASRILGAQSPQSLAGVNLFNLTATKGADSLNVGAVLDRLKNLAPGETHAERWRFQKLDQAGGENGTVDVKLQLTGFPAEARAMVTALLRDVTQEDRYLREQEFLARHDVLTGLLNRYAFLENVAVLADKKTRFAVVLMDLNRFKEVNDSLGHHAGDVVLETLGARLRRLFDGRSVCIARLGGDEIAACADPEHWPGGVAGLCHDLGAAIGQPMTVEGVSLEVTAAIGVAMYPDDATTPGQLLRCADVAMYEAKRAKLGYTRYARQHDRFTAQWLSLKSDFSRALRDESLFLTYQPKVRLLDERLDGFEALSRWTHPIRGPISPAVFVPLAETTELVFPFTNWVVRTAVEQLSKWMREGHCTSISVNISALNLLSADFVDEIQAALCKYAVPPENLELEVTESALMRDQETAFKHLHRLRKLGLRLAIDDFGTGYSSLSYLKRLPVDVLKIDRSFIAAMEMDNADRRIVDWTIQLAHSFGMQVVAEGVETAEAAALLREMGCDVAQGYFYGRPMRPEDTSDNWFRRL